MSLSLCLSPYVSLLMSLSLCLSLYISLPLSISLYLPPSLSLYLPPSLSLPMSSILWGCHFLYLNLAAIHRIVNNLKVPMNLSPSSSSSPPNSAEFGSNASARAKLITVFLRQSDKHSATATASGGFGFTLEGCGPAKLNVIAGGIAHQNGLQSADELLAIDRECVAAMAHLEVVAKMRKVMRRRHELWLTVRRWPPSSSASSSSSPSARSPRRRPFRLPFQRKSLPSHRSNRYKKNRLLSPPPPSFVQKCRGTMPSGKMRQSRQNNSPKHRPRRSLNFAATSNDISSSLSPISNVSGTSPVLSPLSPPSPHLLVAQWALQYLGQFGPLGQQQQHQQQKQCYLGDPSPLVDKCLLLFLRRLQVQKELCVLNVFEEKLNLHLCASSFVASIPYSRVRAVGRSRAESHAFGIFIASGDEDNTNRNDKNEGGHGPTQVVVLMFRCVPREFALHHATHSHFAQAMSIQCRRKQLAQLEISASMGCADADAAQCIQFPLDCGEVLASLRFGIPPHAEMVGGRGGHDGGGTVAKFMAKLAEGLEIGREGEGGFTMVNIRTVNYVVEEVEADDNDDDEDAHNSSTTDSQVTMVDFGISCCSSDNGSQHDETIGGQRRQHSRLRACSSSAMATAQILPPPAPLLCPAERIVSPRQMVDHRRNSPGCLLPQRACRTVPPPLPPKPHFLTTHQTTPFVETGISAQLSIRSLAPPNEFVASERHKGGSLRQNLPSNLKRTEAVADSSDLVVEQHNHRLFAVAPTEVPSVALSAGIPSHCDNKENRKPSPPHPTAKAPQAQAVAARRHSSGQQQPQQKHWAQLGHEPATQPPQQQQTDVPRASPAAPVDQRQLLPQATMPSVPSDGSPKQQPLDSNIDLEQVLKSEAGRAPFHQFLQQQFCAENINFYLAVEEYKKIPEAEFARRTDFGRQIFDRHFAANCIEPVNIDNSTSNQIREAYKNNRFTSEVYDLVQYQILHLLKYDCWPRYLRAGGQLAEEFGGDSKSHDSGASTSQYLVVGGGKQSQQHNQQTRRKSLFRFLWKSGKTASAEAAACGDDGTEEDPQCTCTIPAHRDAHCRRRQRPFDALNGGTATQRRRAHSRSPSKRLGSRNARRSCAEGAAAASGAAAAMLLNASAATTSIGRGGIPRGDGNGEQPIQTIAEGQVRRPCCTCRCSKCKKAAKDEQLGEYKSDFPVRFCTLLCADSATSTEIALSDPFQSVKQWAVAMAEGCGLDKHASEVVDAQTGSTIDPVRQAVDALNNRVVRIIPVVKLPVLFLASSTPCISSAKPSSPMAAKVVILRCRPALTVGKVLRPIMAKYNVDSEQAVVCIAGTCEVLKLQTPVSAICLKTLAVMCQQQFAERKVMPKREYQKELTMVPSWMVSANTPAPTAAASSSTSPSSGQSSPGPDFLLPPFHQQGDVGFCELPLEAEASSSKLGSALLKHSATRSYSSNPREFFKFGRKPTMAKARGDQQQLDAMMNSAGGVIAAGSADPTAGPSGNGGSGVSQLRYRKSGGTGMGSGRSSTAAKEAESRRKSLGAAAAANAIAAGVILHRDSPVGTPTGSTTGVSTSGRLSSAALAEGLVAPGDIPYCGEEEPMEEPPLEQETCSTYAVPTTLIRHESVVYGTKNAVISTSADQRGPSGTEDSRNRIAFTFPPGVNGSTASTASPLPAIFSSTVCSDKNATGGGINTSPSTEAMVWQKADYV